MVVIPDVERRPRVHAVGEQNVQAQGLVVGVELEDVPEQQSVAELVGVERAEDVDVEDLTVLVAFTLVDAGEEEPKRVGEAARGEVDVRGEA